LKKSSAELGEEKVPQKLEVKESTSSVSSILSDVKPVMRKGASSVKNMMRRDNLKKVMGLRSFGAKVNRPPSVPKMNQKSQSYLSPLSIKMTPQVREVSSVSSAFNLRITKNKPHKRDFTSKALEKKSPELPKQKFLNLARTRKLSYDSPELKRKSFVTRLHVQKLPPIYPSKARGFPQRL